MDSEKISLANELSQCCLLPKLVADVDSQQIEARYFENYKRSLDENLHLLFDLVQQNESILFAITEETSIFRTNFVLVLCEQSAPNVPFRSEQQLLIQNIDFLINKWFAEVVDDTHVFDLVMKEYKTKIKTSMWKRNIGAVFGFHMFCQIYYRQFQNKLHLDEAFFVLATGTLMLEHYEPEYKELGIDFYSVLLKCLDTSNIRSTNMHQAVYNTCSSNIPKVKDERNELKLWTCLYECIRLDDSWKNSSDWHRVDEVMIDLLKRIAFEGNIRRSTILLSFASKFGSLTFDAHHVIDEFIEIGRPEKILRESDCDTMLKFDWDTFRNECWKYDSRVIYKWTKKMLLLIANQDKFYGDPTEVGLMLHAIHLTYIVWIFSIPLNLITSQIQTFFTKLIPTLLECRQRFKDSRLVCEEIYQLFATFSIQFHKHPTPSHTKLVKLQKRFETIESIKNALG